MTNEEAKRKIENQKLQFLEEYIDYGGISEAYDMAIQSLEKQIPKKPTPHKVDVEEIKIGGTFWGKGTTVYRCPNCDRLITRAYKHCMNCGQALDWSN